MPLIALCCRTARELIEVLLRDRHLAVRDAAGLPDELRLTLSAGPNVGWWKAIKAVDRSTGRVTEVTKAWPGFGVWPPQKILRLQIVVQRDATGPVATREQARAHLAFSSGCFRSGQDRVETEFQ